MFTENEWLFLGLARSNFSFTGITQSLQVHKFSWRYCITFLSPYKNLFPCILIEPSINKQGWSNIALFNCQDMHEIPIPLCFGLHIKSLYLGLYKIFEQKWPLQSSQNIDLDIIHITVNIYLSLEGTFKAKQK